MVDALTFIGGSVRRSVLEYMDFGVLQEWKCLDMIASPQGGPFPSFPKFTHSHYAYCDELDLQRGSTVQGAIANLEHSTPNHLLMYPECNAEPKIEQYFPHLTGDVMARSQMEKIGQITAAGGFVARKEDQLARKDFLPNYACHGNLTA